MKIENENKKFFPPKATKTQDQQTWVMTYCLLTQKYASYKVGFSKKEGNTEAGRLGLSNNHKGNTERRIQGKR